MAKIRVLLVGSFSMADFLSVELQKEIEMERCSDKAGLQRLMKLSPLTIFHVILCGGELPGMKYSELGQTLRMLYPEAPIFYTNFAGDSIDKKLLLKNGFTNAYLLPDEQDFFKVSLDQALAEVETKLYAPIRLIDLVAGSQINFEIRIHLPKNNRYVAYASPGDTFDENRLARLKKFEMNSIFIPFSDLPKFHEYSAQRLLQLSENDQNTLQAEENQNRLQKFVKELLKGYLSESYANALKPNKKNIEHSKKIIDQYLVLKYPGDWFKKVRSVMFGAGEILSHSSNVAAYAIFFSMVLNIGDHKELATAGMLHDVGLAGLQKKLQNILIEKMTSIEFEDYKKHPGLSIRAIDDQHLKVSKIVTDAIQLHHERWGGGGFPFGVKGSRLSAEAQILALADRFDELTRVDLTSTPLSLDQAIAQLEREKIANPLYLKILRRTFLVSKAS